MNKKNKSLPYFIYFTVNIYILRIKFDNFNVIISSYESVKKRVKKIIRIHPLYLLLMNSIMISNKN